MDINVTLAQLRIAAANALAGAGDEDGVRQAELFTALDEWITRNGFLPADWHRAQLRAVRGATVRAGYNATGPCGSGVPTTQG